MSTRGGDSAHMPAGHSRTSAIPIPVAGLHEPPLHVSSSRVKPHSPQRAAQGFHQPDVSAYQTQFPSQSHSRPDSPGQHPQYQPQYPPVHSQRSQQFAQQQHFMPQKQFVQHQQQYPQQYPQQQYPQQQPFAAQQQYHFAQQHQLAQQQQQRFAQQQHYQQQQQYHYQQQVHPQQLHPQQLHQQQLHQQQLHQQQLRQQQLHPQQVQDEQLQLQRQFQQLHMGYQPHQQPYAQTRSDTAVAESPSANYSGLPAALQAAARPIPRGGRAPSSPVGYNTPSGSHPPHGNAPPPISAPVPPWRVRTQSSAPHEPSPLGQSGYARSQYAGTGFDGPSAPPPIAPPGPPTRKKTSPRKENSEPAPDRTAVPVAEKKHPPMAPPSALRDLPFRNSAPALTRGSRNASVEPVPLDLQAPARSSTMTRADAPPSDLDAHRRTPKLAQALSTLGTRISSGLSHRTSSPGIVSRLSSSLSSRLSSRLSSPEDARSPSIPPVDAIPEPLDDAWPEFEPDVPPTDDVRALLERLCTSVPLLVDIDPGAVNAPSTALTAIPEEERREARAFAMRGVYFHSSAHGTTNDDGQYEAVADEHIGFRYRVIDKLGVGSFGSVLKCRDHKSGRMVAVKVTSSVPGLQSQARVEASILRSLVTTHAGSPDAHHFMRYIEHFRFRGHLCIASELLGLNLYDLVKRNEHRGLGEPTVRYLGRQLAEGLAFLAAKGIIHCDLKPENILISDVARCQIKIVDFGSSCYEGKRLYTYIQSRFYRSPEIMLGLPYGPAIDMWSFGAILVELLLGSPLFPGEDEADLFALMCQHLGAPAPSVLMKCSRATMFVDRMGQPLTLVNKKNVVRSAPNSTPLRTRLQRFSPPAVEFCQKILQWSPEMRLSAKASLTHPFLSALDAPQES